MLAVDLLWIVFGIIYVISKLQKEEHIFTKENVRLLLILSAFIVIPQIIVGVVCDEESAEVVRPIVTLVLIILPLLVLCVYGLSFSIGSEISAKSEAQQTNQDAMQSTDSLRRIFEQRGYYKLSDEMLDKLLHDQCSPIKTRGVYGVGILFCYDWLCDLGTRKVDKLTPDELDAHLGVKLADIPLDCTLPQGEAMLKRNALAKNRVLTKEGLKYRRFREFINEQDNYYEVFNSFVDADISEHQ